MRIFFPILIFASLIGTNTFSQCNSYSLNFNGNGDFAESYLNNSTCNELTFMFWAKFPNTINTPINQSMWLASFTVNNSNNWSGYTDGVVYYTGSSSVPANKNLSGYTYNGNDHYVPSTVTSYSGNTWYHFAYTRDAIGNQKLYINAVLNNTRNFSPPPLLLPQTRINIGGQGSYMGYTGRWFTNCKIDELIIYNRVLTQAEISQKYMTVLTPGNEISLLAYYRFEEGTGSTFYDLGPNSLNGLLHSTTQYSSDVPFGVSTVTTAVITPFSSTSICFGDSVKLMANSGVAYLWSTGATTQNIFALNQGNYTVTITAANGCTAISPPLLMSISNPTSSITISGDSLLCAGDSVKLSANSGNSYLWSNGNISSSIYAIQPGNYQVTVTNADNCTAVSRIQSISVSNPLAVIYSNSNGILCNNDTFLISCNPGISYLWSTGETTSSIKISIAGPYFVSVTNTDGCSIASDTFQVQQSFVHADIFAIGNSSLCEGDSCLLLANGNGTIIWSDGITDSVNYINSTGNYFATITNSLGCSINSDTLSIHVNPIPIVRFTMDSLIDCDSYNITFHNISVVENNAIFQWDLDNGNFSTDQNPYFEFPSPGIFNIELIVTSPYGCISSLQSSLNTISYIPPIAYFSIIPDSIFFLGDHVVFNNQSTNGSTYLWDFGDRTFSNQVNPIHKYMEAGTYQVLLTTYSGKNCYDTYQLTIEVIPLIIPNAFTPNNDGTNDQFPGVNLMGGKNIFELQVFNRWGQKIFITNDPMENFKGKFKNGENCPEGVYVYILKLESQTGFQFNKSGCFSLLR